MVEISKLSNPSRRSNILKQQLSITQILLYYDLPQIPVASDAVGTKFISLLVEINEQETKYLATAISKKRLAGLINGNIDLRTVFEYPEIQQYFTFEYDDDTVEAESYSDVIPKEYLPAQGFIFDKKSENEEIIVEAVEKNNA